jgi:hypothetical protein
MLPSFPVTNNSTKDKKSLSSSARVLTGIGGKELYYVGIIDFLVEYNTRKKLESAVHLGNKSISSIPPREYAERMVKFIEAGIM